ncbi:MAG TPA: isoprenylcysteine carboxylmethyltransferase family protein [Candidatus Bathyarchaeia archaeon]|nr:isoprenylcysteine carboxylmethyltransferase family protein [Candidatus Bathyarchaeia archaeon]
MTSELVFKIILIVLYSIFTIIRIHFSRKARKSTRKSAIKESKVRLTILQTYIFSTVIIFFLYIFSPEWFGWGTIPLYPEAVRWIGVGAGVVSQVLFTIVHIHLGQNFSYTLRIGDDHALITDGPYRYVRHPMYSAFLLFHVSIFLVTKNWFFGIIWIIGLTLFLFLRITKEEEMLMEVFGEKYQEYKTRTGALFFPVFKILKKETRSKIKNSLWNYQAISNMSLTENTEEKMINWFEPILETYRANMTKSPLLITDKEKNENEERILWSIKTSGLLDDHQLEITCQPNQIEDNYQLRIKAKGQKEFIKEIRLNYENYIGDLSQYNLIFYGP